MCSAVGGADQVLNQPNTPIVLSLGMYRFLVHLFKRLTAVEGWDLGLGTWDLGTRTLIRDCSWTPGDDASLARS